MKAKKVKAVGLLSGGLDSTLAVKLVLDQGIDVVALNFTSPFCLCNQRGKCYSLEAAKKFGIPYKTIAKGEKYLEVIRNPKHGYGSAMNPCIDCRIFMLKEAKKYMKKIVAKFLFTGEVLGQRPMSQHWKALKLIEKEAGLEGKIVRPLSAKLLPPTEAEKNGWIDRSKLLGIGGRSRKPQFALAKKLGIRDYPCPAGGCLLTYREFANKVRDLFKHKKNVTLKDIELLKIGRHFRYGKNKIIVGRNEQENKKLKKLKNSGDFVFEADIRQTPTTILQGPKTKEAIKKAAVITARYSDAKTKKVPVKFGKKTINISPVSKKELEKLRINI